MVLLLYNPLVLVVSVFFCILYHKEIYYLLIDNKNHYYLFYNKNRPIPNVVFDISKP